MDHALAVEIEHVSRQKELERQALRGVSDIRGFYSGSTALVTGGTGFIGKQLVEKLLRSCDVKRIYLILRSKKGVSIEERLKKQWTDPLYDKLRSEQPHFEKKISVMSGEMSELRIGLSDEDVDKIAQEVNVIFHVAATTKFDEPLKKATLINVRGTREILQLAKQCKNLRSFVHVSTAFSFATRSRIDGDIEEQFYSSPVPPHVIIQLAETVDEERLNAATAGLITDWPNTYCFTKGIAEDLVRTLGEDLPIAIVRPPVVIPTLNEPTPGWVDKSALMSPAGYMLGISLGVTHVFLTDDKKLMLVPLDYVNNTIISAAWETDKRYRNNEKETKIYNISVSKCGIQRNKYNSFLRCPENLKYASPKAIWYCYGFDTSNLFIFWLLNWLLHYIPAYVADFVYNITGMKRPEGIKSFVKVYEKIYKGTLLYGYFLCNEWNFIDNNMAAMIDKMSKTDKVLFNIDVKTIDWFRLMVIWIIGLRKFIIKDGLKDSEYGMRKQKWLMFGHVAFYTLFSAFVGLFLYVSYRIVMCVF